MTKENEPNEIEDLMSKINELIGAGAEAEELLELTKVEADEHDMNEYHSQGLYDTQLVQIAKGKEAGLNVELYDKPEFNWRQMNEIRIGMLHGIDASVYANSLYTWDQMHEIRLGLEDELDVSKYTQLIFSVEDMKNKRRKLFAEAYEQNPNRFAKMFVDDEVMIKMHIDDTCMTAYVEIPDFLGNTIGPKEVIDALKRNRITYGIHEDAIEEIFQEKLFNKKIMVAKGTQPEAGQTGAYEALFNEGNPSMPTELPDGRVDYTSVVAAEAVEPDQELVRYHRAGAGKDGMTVTELPVWGKAGLDLPELRGKGITKKGDSYCASKKGYASFDRVHGQLNVWERYVVNGDINIYNGNIEYDGSIVINGNVSGAVKLKASGNVMVQGLVEDAIIEAGQNVIIKKGVNAKGKGLIVAGEKVMCGFYESANVIAKGTIEGNYFLNCRIETDDKVIARGSKSRIMGGTITAALGIEAAIIGNYMSHKMNIEVGNGYVIGIKVDKVQKEIDKANAEIAELEKGKQKLVALMSEEIAVENSLYKKADAAIFTKNAEIMTLNMEMRRLKRIYTMLPRAYVKTTKELQQNVVLDICGKKTILTEKKGAVRISRDHN